MSITCHSLRLTTMIFAIVVLFVTGCGSDATNSPLNVNPLDEAAPLAPTGISVDSQYLTKFAVSWMDNAEPDLAGYRVYMYDPDPMRSNAYVVMSGANPVNRARMTVAGEDGKTYIFRVAAVDMSFNESTWSAPFTFTFHEVAEHELCAPGGTDSENPSYDLPGADGREVILPNESGLLEDRK